MRKFVVWVLCLPVYNIFAKYILEVQSQCQMWIVRLMTDLYVEFCPYYLLLGKECFCIMCKHEKYLEIQKNTTQFFFLVHVHIVYCVYISVNDLMWHQKRIQLFHFSHKTRPSYSHKRLYIHNYGREISVIRIWDLTSKLEKLRNLVGHELFFFFKIYLLIDWLIDCYVGSSFLC